MASSRIDEQPQLYQRADKDALAGPTPVYGDGDAATACRRGSRSHKRAIIASIAVASVAVCAVLYGFQVRRNDGYVGTSKSATLTWECWNAIFWTDPSNDVTWWAGPERALNGRLVTAKDPLGATYSSVKRATGSVHFDRVDRATFLSDAGGTIVLNRQAAHQAYELSCEGGPED